MSRLAPHVLLLLPLAFPPLPAAAQPPVPLGEDFRVNTVTTRDQQFADVAMSPSGDFVVVWQGVEPGTFSTFDVFGQLYDAAGNRRGGELPINTYTPNWQISPEVASDAEGGFVVVWQSNGQSGTSYSIFGQRFDATGGTLGAEFAVNTYTTGSQRSPDVASGANGDFTVVWADDVRGGIFGRFYDADGTPLATEQQLNTTPLGGFPPPMPHPAVAASAAGRFVAVWENDDGYFRGVFGQRFDAGGVPLGNEFQVNITTVRDQANIDVSSAADGAFVVTWASDDITPLQTRIMARRYDASGTPQGGELQASSASSFTSAPAVGSAGDGAFVVTWTEPVGGIADLEIRARSFDATGEPRGEELQVNTHTPEVQAISSVAVDADGDFVIVWHSYDRGIGDDDVFGRRFAGPGLHLEAAGSCPGTVSVSIVNAPPGTEVAVVAAANTNGFIKGALLCPGTRLEIGEPFQLPPTFVIVNEDGRGQTQLELGVDRCWVEALALADCQTSGAVFVPTRGTRDTD